jgi:hypothetical protein
LLSRQFRFLDVGPSGANADYEEDQQHYRRQALADLQTGVQIPLWPQGRGNFKKFLKVKFGGFFSYLSDPQEALDPVTERTGSLHTRSVDVLLGPP